MKSRGGGSDIDLGLGIIDDEVIIGLAEIDSGQCGDNAYYKLYGNGLLEISGTGAIAMKAFENRNDIVNVVVGDGITEIGRLSFISCDNITSVVLPDSVTIIGGRAFEDCISLASINIPDGVTSIGDTEFYYCTSLTSITLSESLTVIGGLAFGGCTALTEVTIPAATPPTIDGEDPFDGCTALTAIYVPYDSMDAYKAAWPDYASIIDNIEGIAGKGSCGDNATWVLYKSGQLVISGTGGLWNRLKITWDSAKIVDVLVGEGITSLNADMFKNCTNIRDVHLPSTLTSLGSNVFRNSSLRSINIPVGVTIISPHAFRECSNLTTLTLPDTITKINNAAFTSSGLTALTVLATTPPTLGTNTLPNTSTLQAIYVPATSVDTYKAASNWSTYASVIQAIPSGD